MRSLVVLGFASGVAAFSAPGLAAGSLTQARASTPVMGWFQPSDDEKKKFKIEKLRGASESVKESLRAGANLPIIGSSRQNNFMDFSLKDKRVSDPRSKQKVKSKSGTINPKDPKTW